MAAYKSFAVPAEKTPVVSRAETSVVIGDTSPYASTSPQHTRRTFCADARRLLMIEMAPSGVFSMAAANTLALHTIDIFSADTTGVLSAAQSASSSSSLVETMGWQS